MRRLSYVGYTKCKCKFFFYFLCITKITIIGIIKVVIFKFCNYFVDKLLLFIIIYNYNCNNYYYCNYFVAYPNWFINKIITKFENNNFNNTNDCNFSNTQEIQKKFAFTFGIPYIGKPSHTFSKKLRTSIKNKFNVNMNIYFRSFKVGNYFQLKCFASTELSSNVVYKFSCPCDTAISYIGYTTCHLITRAHEHLNLNSIAKSAIKDHISYTLVHIVTKLIYL